MRESYHHKNLKNDLIENAIQIISKEGIEAVSLRSLSQKCNVSHNAIYRHFESKEKLLECARDYVTEKLCAHLKNSIEKVEKYDIETINILGFSYIDFYKNNKTYFSFLYRNSKEKITLTLDDIEDNYSPFEIFRCTFLNYIKISKISREDGLKKLIHYWADLNGLVSFIVSSNVEFDEKYKICLEDILK